jgi:hypothetical protein
MSKPRNAMRRYHYKVYFPNNTVLMCLEFFKQIKEIGLTYHAGHQMLDDQRGIIPMPDKADLMNDDNILVEFYELLDNSGNPLGIMQKALIRVKHLSDMRDYSYLVAREGYVISAWANDKNDEHRLTNKKNDYFEPSKKERDLIAA